MKFIKYTLYCFLEIFGLFDIAGTPGIPFHYAEDRIKAIYGVFQWVALIGTFLILFLVVKMQWWIALLIVIGGYLAVCFIGTIVELGVKEINRFKKGNVQDHTEETN